MTVMPVLNVNILCVLYQTVPVKNMKVDEISSLLELLGFYNRSQKGEEVPEQFQYFPLRAPRDEL